MKRIMRLVLLWPIGIIGTFTLALAFPIMVCLIYTLEKNLTFRGSCAEYWQFMRMGIDLLVAEQI